MRDHLDIISELSLVARDVWEERLSEEIKQLLDAGVVLLGGRYVRKLESPGQSEPWPGAVIRVIPLAGAQGFAPATSGRMSASHAAAIALAQVLIDKGDKERAEAQLRPVAEAGNSHAQLLLGTFSATWATWMRLR